MSVRRQGREGPRDRLFRHLEWEHEHDESLGGDGRDDPVGEVDAAHVQPVGHFAVGVREITGGIHVIDPFKPDPEQLCNEDKLKQQSRVVILPALGLHFFFICPPHHACLQGLGLNAT